jgi:hypothetical protein
MSTLTGSRAGVKQGYIFASEISTNDRTCSNDIRVVHRTPTALHVGVSKIRTLGRLTGSHERVGRFYVGTSSPKIHGACTNLSVC